MNLKLEDFPEFFKAIHGNTPFPWQTMLLSRVLNEGWPELLALPTASGKTACLDIAVFAMAMQARMPWNKRTTARRIYFVVDRRIVVDEAFERANKIVGVLKSPKNLITRAVADELSHLAQGGEPLAVARLRGGIANKAGLPNNPLEPALVTSTVDQIGSRLLFRSYACGNLRAPVDAALVAYDSLIILDEAHCSVPFCQTAHAVQNYLQPRKGSNSEVIAPPMKLMVMSATPPSNMKFANCFPAKAERDNALNHPILRKRLEAKKLAILVSCRKKGADAMNVDALEKVGQQIAAGCRRIAVMVNRVRTAHSIYDAIRASDICRPVLLTGRMRPIDRDQLMNDWSPKLKSGSPPPGPDQKPVVVITTQCLEVGADFSFDALITECASLDALQQRFGRLDRLGNIGKTHAFILARESDVKQADDPIYGGALAKTWAWLEGQDKKPVDFGVEAMRIRVQSLSDVERDMLLAPQQDAPSLMPAHLDLLCQTAPIPVPTPDVPAYLHGLGRGEPEVRIAFRADLTGEDASAWNELLEACPPSTLECLPVPISRIRHWLISPTMQTASQTDGPEDVEGVAMPAEVAAEKCLIQRRFALRREQQQAAASPKSRRIWQWIITSNVSEIQAGDLIVLPPDSASSLPSELGTALEGAPLDRGDESHWQGKGRLTLRIHPNVLSTFTADPNIQQLLEWAGGRQSADGPDGRNLDELRSILEKIAKLPSQPWLGELAMAISRSRKLQQKHVRSHPCAKDDAVLISIPTGLLAEDEDEDSASLTDQAVELDVHLLDAANAARRFASAVSPALASTLEHAARWHDLGKIDPRFQAWLRGDDEPLYEYESLWAKGDVPLHGSSGFRHEMLSVELLSGRPDLFNEIDKDLSLHLIAAHHGYARPFAPYRAQNELPGIVGSAGDEHFNIDSAARAKTTPSYALASGIPDRFWRMTRRFGWWGAAYLEMLVRMADWHASAHPSEVAQEKQEVPA